VAARRARRQSHHLKTEHEPHRLGARAADHHRPALGLLAIAQDHVAVVRLAAKDAHLARAAHALLAGEGHVDADRGNRLQDRLTGLHRHLDTALATDCRELAPMHREALAAAG
jgi:hypothetical protein